MRTPESSYRQDNVDHSELVEKVSVALRMEEYLIQSSLQSIRILLS